SSSPSLTSAVLPSPMRLLLFLPILFSIATAKPGRSQKSLAFEIVKELEDKQDRNEPITCYGCIGAAASLATLAKLTPTEDVILWFAKGICSIKQPSEVCEGITEQFRDEFFYVFRRLADEPSKICAALIPGCVDPLDPTGEGWNIKLPLPLSPPSSPSSSPSSSTPPNVLRVLSITDLHVDFHYEPGSEAECADPVCCRESTSRNERNSVPAGFWGTVGKCEIPYRTLNHMLKHISQNDHVGYIMVGGDIVDHYDWKYNWDGTLEVLRNISGLFKLHFPTTPVYWALGNHEGVPVNSFAPHSVDERFWPIKLYDELTEMNKPWVKNEDEDDSSRFRGSWSTLAAERLRIISINTGFCINTNFFLYLNQSDPEGTMTWFVEQLHKAELAGENVHVLAHIPPGYDDCLEGWSRNYYRIVQRFSSIITGQFFGHVHYDYFTLFYEDMFDITSEPVGVAYISPSASTFDYLNPGYRIYTIDAENTYSIIDHDNYFADLDVADKNTEPEWKLLY
ncbi:hypothetical protein PFISCL1PPCAC_27884, partial [Pristionchus fissidentatus]